jgi:hypothetical protein
MGEVSNLSRPQLKDGENVAVTVLKDLNPFSLAREWQQTGTGRTSAWKVFRGKLLKHTRVSRRIGPGTQAMCQHL